MPGGWSRREELLVGVWSPVLPVGFFAEVGLWSGEGQEAEVLTHRWKADGLPEDFQLVIQPVFQCYLL